MSHPPPQPSVPHCGLQVSPQRDPSGSFLILGPSASSEERRPFILSLLLSFLLPSLIHSLHSSHKNTYLHCARPSHTHACFLHIKGARSFFSFIYITFSTCKNWMRRERERERKGRREERVRNSQKHECSNSTSNSTETYTITYTVPCHRQPLVERSVCYSGHNQRECS
jgi:hypothetical protein